MVDLHLLIPARSTFSLVKQTYGQLVLPASSSVIVNRIKAKLVDADSTIDLSSSDVEAIISREVNTVLSRTKAIMEGEEEKQTARYIQPAGATIDSIITHDDRLMSVMMRLYGFPDGGSYDTEGISRKQIR